LSNFVKGALALLAAVVVLMAGYGTYALWSDSETLNGGTVSSGQLAFEGATPGVWADVSDGAPGDVIADITTFQIVPGDVLTYTLTRTVRASGDNLVATLAADPASVAGDPELLADVAVTTGVTVNGAAAGPITEANDGQAVVATVTFTFDEASTNETQLQELDLSALELTLTQNAR
jgi:alternate signal-mediated exported protein